MQKVTKAVLLVTLTALLLLSAGLGGALASADGQAVEGGKLVFLGYGDEFQQKVWQEAIDKFTAETGVAAEMQFAPTSTWGEFANKLTARVASGGNVDLIGVAIEGARLLVSKDLFAPLNGYMEGDPEAQEMIEDIAPALFDAFRVDGELYELPFDWNSMVIVYNTALFDAAGIPYPSEDWTWDEFAEIAQKLTQGEGENKVWGFANTRGPIQTMPWFITNNTSILDAEMKNSVLDSPEAAESMQFVNDLVYKYQCTPLIGGSTTEAEIDVIQLFGAGRVAMIGGWQGLLPMLKDSGFETFDVQAWPAKQPDASRTVFGVGGIGIANRSKNKDLAWELLKEMISKDVIQQFANRGAAIPVRQSAANSEAFLGFANNAKMMYEGAYTGITMPSPVNFPEMEQIFMRNYDMMMTSQQDVGPQMQALHQELQTAMEEIQ